MNAPRFGLSAQTIRKLHSVLVQHPHVLRAVVYGSRAKGNYRPGSDIDLTLHAAPGARIDPRDVVQGVVRVADGRSRIGVDVSDLNITVNGDRATARFRQDYTSDTLNVTSRKTLELVKSGGRWLIVRESTGS
mgnify:CR=1 FL=1